MPKKSNCLDDQNRGTKMNWKADTLKLHSKYYKRKLIVKTIIKNVLSDWLILLQINVYLFCW